LEKNGQITKLIKTHLEPFGYPSKITIEKVFEELPNIWEKMSSKGLIPPGISYDIFVIIAQQACHEKWVESVFDSFRQE